MSFISGSMFNSLKSFHIAGRYIRLSIKPKVNQPISAQDGANADQD
jgi:hypothetical protein